MPIAPPDRRWGAGEMGIAQSGRPTPRTDQLRGPPAIALVNELTSSGAILRQKTDDRRRLLREELEDVEGRLKRWEDAFERGDPEANLGLERVHTLRAKKAELEETLKKIVPLRPPPVDLASREAIDKFRATLKDLLQEKSNGLARGYLRFLIDQIVVRDTTVMVRAKNPAALQAMATGTIRASFSQADEVRGYVPDWLPMPYRSRTCSVECLERKRSLRGAWRLADSRHDLAARFSVMKRRNSRVLRFVIEKFART